jgi:carbamate kinase
LLLLTDVDAVYEAWGSNDARAIEAIAPDKLQALDLPAGTMGPKAEAAAWFARSTGNPAVIGSLNAAEDLIRGVAGTRITVPPV